MCSPGAEEKRRHHAWISRPFYLDFEALTPGFRGPYTWVSRPLYLDFEALIPAFEALIPEF
jgi:hypothetical protein